MSLAAIFAMAKFWHWWIAGAVLLIIEVAAPGRVLPLDGRGGRNYRVDTAGFSIDGLGIPVS